MTILQSELKLYRSKIITNDATNGGRLSINEIVSGVPNNVWLDADKAERDAGSTTYRKTFLKNTNASALALKNTKIWVNQFTPADDYIIIFPATAIDVQGGITGAERIYGQATLNTSVVAGATTLILDVESSDIAGMFQDGDYLNITDKALPDSTTGNNETVLISGAPVVVGAQITVTLAAGTLNAYAAYDFTLATGGRIAAIMLPGDVVATFDNWVVTSASGLYDIASYPLILDNIGTVEQTWTYDFSDATNYTLTGDTLGAVGSGTVGADFAPLNPDFNVPYSTLEYLGFGGTFAGGDTIVTQTHAATCEWWEKRVIPALAGSLSGNKVTIGYSGESA